MAGTATLSWINQGSSLLNGLVGYWKMDESSGNITDYSGNGNTGTPTGTITYSATGKINTAIKFAAALSHIDCGNGSSLQLGSTGSIFLWVNLSAVSVVNTLVGKMDIGNDQNGYQLNIDATTNNLYFEMANGTTANGKEGTTVFTTGTWYHVGVTWNGSLIQLYINGATEGTALTQTVTPVSNVWNLHLGRSSTNGTTMSGTLDEIGIWNRALTGTEITNLLYNSGSGLSYPF